MGNWTPRKLSPRHLQVIRYHWQGDTADEIALKTRYIPEHISTIINSEAGQEALRELSSGSLDSTTFVETLAQAMAPVCMEELFRLATGSVDERVRKSSCRDVLDIAGHVPVRRISLERVDPVADKYSDLTEEQLREMALGGKGQREAEERGTVH